jgi:hypothetical protein
MYIVLNSMLITVVKRRKSVLLGIAPVVNIQPVGLAHGSRISAAT